MTGRHAHAAPRVVGGDRLARARQAERLRIVAQGDSAADERLEQRRSGYSKPASVGFDTVRSSKPRPVRRMRSTAAASGFGRRDLPGTREENMAASILRLCIEQPLQDSAPEPQAAEYRASAPRNPAGSGSRRRRRRRARHAPASARGMTKPVYDARSSALHSSDHLIAQVGIEVHAVGLEQLAARPA